MEEEKGNQKRLVTYLLIHFDADEWSEIDSCAMANYRP